MGHSHHDPTVRERRPWNTGRLVGAKRALKPQQVWAIRFWLERERRLRNLSTSTKAGTPLYAKPLPDGALRKEPFCP